MPDDTIIYAPEDRGQVTSPAGMATISQTIAAWGEAAGGWVRARCDAVKFTHGAEDALHLFAEIAREAREPEEVRAGLARLALQVSHAERVELHRTDAPGQGPNLVACWPDPPPLVDAASDNAPLCLPIELGGRPWGMLQLWPGRRGPCWSPRVVRVLSTLGLMAASADLALRALRGAGAVTPLDPITGLYNELYLRALLAHTMYLAHRRRVPVALLCVGPDWPADAREGFDPTLSDAALQAVARALKETLRASDVIARFDNGTLVAILPAADTNSVPAIAEAVRNAIAEAGLISATPIPLTVSLGVASYPEYAEHAELLRAAATALAVARAKGGNRVVIAPRPASALPLSVVPRAG